jgi:16S rRNA (cytidine1402-2'-O)-methyltransferase
MNGTVHGMSVTSPGTLSIVATPIGNLEDITLRALRVLKEADYVLCEDTRVTGKLLAHYEIKAKLKRYDAHTSEGVHEAIVADLEAGQRIALVSDAGTPGVSDPGVFLVAKVRALLPGVRIDAVPGPSALAAAFSIAGITGNEFTFLGFVPQKKGRETFFRALGDYDHPVMFYESVHRIMKTLNSLVAVAQNPDAPVNWSITVARELTKMHEEVVQGSPEEVLQYFIDHPDRVRGEFVVIVG